MPYKFFSNSKNTWQAMFDAIKAAEESVYLEMYIFEDDMKDFDFLELLKQKALSGVRVRVILDSFGSFSLGNDAVKELRDAKVELFFISYFFHRTHRKILILDERTAFIGGVNFQQLSRKWNDLAVQITGGLVPSILRSFAKVYALSGGKDPVILVHNKRVILDKTRTWLVEHFPIRKNKSLKKVYQEHINGAEKNITLVTPYFMPKRWLIRVLHQAILRGVAVEVLIPKTTEFFLVDRVNYFFMAELSELGVQFYLEPNMNHAKVMIIDGKEGMVGSNNLDFLSFDLNSEVGIFFKDEDAIGKLLEIVNEWKQGTTLFESKIYRSNYFDYVLSQILGFFYKIF